MQIRETLAQVLAHLARLGYKPVFVDKAPLDATLYGAGWGTIVFEKCGEYWQAVLNQARRIVVVSRLG